jgi:hypothetical protein
MNGFAAIEEELRKRREQAESVRGKDTPFRVEFRYRGRTKHWQYFMSREDALRAEDSYLTYGPRGNAIVIRPYSQVIQIRGPQGGWSQEKRDAA